MKMSKRLWSYITLIFNTTSAIGGTITTVYFLNARGRQFYKYILEIVTPILEQLYPSMSPQHQILNILVLILVALIYIVIWIFIFYSFRAISKIVLTKYTQHILLDLEEQAIDVCSAAFDELAQEHLKKLEDKIDKIDKKLEESQPHLPPHALTGQLAPRDGQYYSQIDPTIITTYEKGDILLPILNQYKMEIRTVWIYIPPQAEIPEQEYPI